MHPRARRRFRVAFSTFVVFAVLTFTLLLTAASGASDAAPAADLPVRGADAGVNPWEANGPVSPPDVRAGVTDAGVNPWAANNPAVLAEALDEAVVLPLPGGERP